MPDEPIQPADPRPLPVEPSAPPVSLAKDGNSTATSTGLPPNIAAGLSAIFLVLGGIVVLLTEKKDAFTRFWAMQTLVFGLFWLVVELALSFVGMILYHIPLIGGLWGLVGRLVYLCFVVAWIFLIVKAFTGTRWEMPIVGPIAKQQLTRFGTRL